MTDQTVASVRPLGSSGLSARPLAWSFRPGPGTTAESAAKGLAAARHAGFGLVTVSPLPQPGTHDSMGAAEEVFRDALAREDRGDMLIALKTGVLPGPVYDCRAPALVAAVDASLTRLGLDAVDLVLVHRPDILTHPLETAEALTTLVRTGRTRAIGVANHGPSQLRALLAYLETPLAVALTPFSILDMKPLHNGLLDLLLERGIACLASAPLAEGQLGDRPGQEANVTARTLIRGLDAIAGQQGVSRAVVAAAFVLQHPLHPIPLFGTQDPREIEGLTAVLRVGLQRHQWYRLFEAALGERLPAGEADR